MFQESWCKTNSKHHETNAPISLHQQAFSFPDERNFWNLPEVQIGRSAHPSRNFSKYIPLECIFINDANAAGFAEARYIDNDAVYLSLSDSVGGAIILNKKLYTGENIRAGEFGHITIEPKGEKCYCGKIGCLDCYTKANLLSNLAEGKLDMFFKELKNGNKQFLKAWNNYLHYLSIAVNNLRMSFDCDIIIGGYIGSYFKDYIEDFRTMVSQSNIFENNADYIKVCRHHFEGSALGASLLHIYNFIEKI